MEKDVSRQYQHVTIEAENERRLQRQRLLNGLDRKVVPITRDGRRNPGGKPSALLSLLNKTPYSVSGGDIKELSIKQDSRTHADKSDVVTCASNRPQKETFVANNHSLIRAQLASKPWRTGGVTSNKFFPTMDQQGLSSPLSSSCIVSVTNTNYYSEQTLNQQPTNQRKHSYQQLDNFDCTPEKMEKRSEDSMDKYTAGMDMKSPTDGLKAKRYNRTAEALKVSGLMDITMKTAELLKKNKQLQSELDVLKKDSREFLQTVLENPENHHLRDTYFSNLTSNTQHSPC